MKVRTLMVWVGGLVLAACSGAPGSSTGSSGTVDGVKGSLGSAKSHDGGRDDLGDDEHEGDASSCKAPDGGPCARDDNGEGDEHKGDASSCKAPDGGRSPCAGGDEDDDDGGEKDNGDDNGRKDGGRKD